jgi:bifunctional DNA-binding transcriptional regulator/antitoxin component of YhaV-PrlF toxin-antitoxin module
MPQSLRRKLGIGPKTKLPVYPYSDSLIMKRLEIGDDCLVAGGGSRKAPRSPTALARRAEADGLRWRRGST